MLAESFVAIMALTAACVLDPGIYFAMNAPTAAIGNTAANAAQVISSWGFTITPDMIEQTAKDIGETTILSRAGGAPTLAVGMAQILAQAIGGKTMEAFWYHFAILFEALFILTTVDAGTRVGRFMFQELAGHVWKPLGRLSWYPSILFSSAVVVAGWGYFTYQGVIDPLGGINSLWPLFGIANQLLAAIALCVSSTIIIKMGKIRYSWVTLVPLVWLTAATLTAGWQKVFSPDPSLGFLSHAQSLANSTSADAARLIFNDRLDAALSIFFMLIVVVVILASAREWYLVAARRKAPRVQEAPFVQTALDVTP
jgi:carbon starvation protein